jgi:hypothetical protein
LFCQAKRLLNAWLMDILFTIFRICGSQQIAPAREEGLVRESSDPWAGLRSTRRRRRAGNCGACLSHGVETREQSSGARIEAKQRDQSLLRSPAGYWEAQPTATWCGQPGSNRHSACAPRDFKSLASTNSAMPAALICLANLPHAGKCFAGSPSLFCKFLLPSGSCGVSPAVMTCSAGYFGECKSP